MDKPRIKPLRWEYHPAGAKAEPPTGHAYIIDTRMEGRVYTIKGLNPQREFASTDDAKAAAQADYEARILAALEPVTDAPDWEGFGRDLLESWPVRDVDGAELFDAALRNRLIREIPGGYDPEQHIDADGICPEPGDPWYEYAFGAQEDTQ